MTHLRIRRDEQDEPGTPSRQGPETYPFPAAAVASPEKRTRLVAAVVSPRAQAEEPPTLRFAGRPVTGGHPAQIVREIEATLSRMQNRLDTFREQLDDAFKFPTPPTDDPTWPPAA